MKEITAFMSDNGQIFSSKEACLNHENELVIKDKLTSLLDDIFYSNITQKNLLDALYANIPELLTILSLSKFSEIQALKQQNEEIYSLLKDVCGNYCGESNEHVDCRFYPIYQYIKEIEEGE